MEFILETTKVNDANVDGIVPLTERLAMLSLKYLSDIAYQEFRMNLPELQSFFIPLQKMKVIQRNIFNSFRLRALTYSYVRKEDGQILGIEYDCNKRFIYGLLKLFVTDNQLKSYQNIACIHMFDATVIYKEPQSFYCVKISGIPFKLDQSLSSLTKMGIYFAGEDGCQVNVQKLISHLTKITGVDFFGVYKKLVHYYCCDYKAIRALVIHAANVCCVWCKAEKTCKSKIHENGVTGCVCATKIGAVGCIRHQVMSKEVTRGSLEVTVDSIFMEIVHGTIRITEGNGRDVISKVCQSGETNRPIQRKIEKNGNKS